MKKTTISISFLIILLASSCTKVLYTHQEVMGMYKTKNDVIKQYGLPTEKRKEEGIEEWLYNYGTVSTSTNYGNSNTNASVRGTNNGAYGSSNTNSVYVTKFNNYERYAKFTFNTNGDIISWGSQGLDYSVMQPAPGKTVLAIISSTAVLAGTVLFALFMSE